MRVIKEIKAIAFDTVDEAVDVMEIIKDSVARSEDPKAMDAKTREIVQTTGKTLYKQLEAAVLADGPIHTQRGKRGK